ncbi:XRE family transcriptional regulator [Pseudonocardia sp.]|uniref:XRE family transcriptional regulator n=1 Tax=Pseudonocardia sp. TaxID=60912 RepID=UPI002607985E|nr:XRE family transcriptional regulator [Pseudonocardia sp.]
MGANDALRAARLSRPSALLDGEPMSRGELADAANAHLWQTTHTRYALDAHTIARYERGVVRWPSAAYRSALRAVLGVDTDAELGFRPTRRGRAGPDLPGPDGDAQATDVPLDRREVLRTGLAGLAAVAVGGGRGHASPADYRRELEHLQQLDRAQGSDRALAGVLGTLTSITTALRASQGADRVSLLGIAARSAEFAGFLYRDLGDRVRSLHWHDRAMEWAQQGDDVAMQSYVLLRKAQAAYDERDARRMLDLTMAAGRGEDALGPGLRAEIHQQRARGEAMLGATDRDVRRRLEVAHDQLSGATGRQDPDEPGMHYSEKLLTLQTAVCLTEAGRPAEAVVLYQRILADGISSARDDAYFRILLSTSLALSGEPDEAARTACGALPVAVATHSRRSIGEARSLLGALQPWRQRSQVRALEDALRTAAQPSPS